MLPNGYGTSVQCLAVNYVRKRAPSLSLWKEEPSALYWVKLEKKKNFLAILQKYNKFTTVNTSGSKFWF